MTTLVEATCTEDPNKAFFTRCRLPSGQFRSPSQLPQTRRCLYAYHVRISLAASLSFVKIARQKRRKARSYRFGSLISTHCTNPERVASRVPSDISCSRSCCVCCFLMNNNRFRLTLVLSPLARTPRQHLGVSGSLSAGSEPESSQVPASWRGLAPG